MSEARDQVREALRSAISPADPTIDSVLDNMVDALLAASVNSGWVIWGGAVREVEIADRFGPSSWEITTDEHAGDRESWGRYGAE